MIKDSREELRKAREVKRERDMRVFEITKRKVRVDWETKTLETSINLKDQGERC